MSESAKAGGPAGYMPQLDALRAFAVAGVMFNHSMPLAWATRVELDAPGVYTFFVLSGFLITGILLRLRKQYETDGGPIWKCFGTFYARRFLRIFPLYYFALAVTCLAGIREVRENLYWHALYLSNVAAVIPGVGLGRASHFWSLSVEEQFYLVWPFVVILTPRRWLLPLFAGVIALGPLSRFVLFQLRHQDLAAAAAPGLDALGAGSFLASGAGRGITSSCLDTLGAGSLLALLWSRGETPSVRRQPHRALFWTGMATTAVLFAVNFWDLPFLGGRVTFAATAWALWVVYLVSYAARGFGRGGRAILEAKPLVYLGKISYGMYVYHPFVPDFVRFAEQWFGISLGLPAERGAAFFAYTLGATTVVASLSWVLLEKPISDLKRYFQYA